jgi:hypothetical protein
VLSRFWMCVSMCGACAALLPTVPVAARVVSSLGGETVGDPARASRPLAFVTGAKDPGIGVGGYAAFGSNGRARKAPFVDDAGVARSSLQIGASARLSSMTR